jgi:hypothetical protein
MSARSSETILCHQALESRIDRSDHEAPYVVRSATAKQKVRRLDLPPTPRAIRTKQFMGAMEL